MKKLEEILVKHTPLFEEYEEKIIEISKIEHAIDAAQGEGRVRKNIIASERTKLRQIMAEEKDIPVEEIEIEDEELTNDLIKVNQIRLDHIMEKKKEFDRIYLEVLWTVWLVD